MEKMSRRGFLGILGGAAAAAALAGCETPNVERPPQRPNQRPRTPERQPATPSDPFEPSEPHEERWDQEPMWVVENQQAMEAMRNFDTTLSVFGEELQEQFGIHFETERPSKLSLAQQDAIKALFIERGLANQFQQITEALIHSKSTELLDRAKKMFAVCSSQGLLYQTMSLAAKRTNQVIPFRRDETYYGAKLREFPLSVHTSNIWSQDIDPRNKTNLDPADRRFLVESPGWSGRAHKREFRAVVSRQALVDLAREHDLNLAEYYSLIRIIIKNRDPHKVPSEAADYAVAQKCMERRRIFREQRLLDPDTKNMLIFYGENHDLTYHGDYETQWVNIGQAAGVDDRNIKKFGAHIGSDVGQVLQRFYQAIGVSQGKTFLSMNAHGSPETLLVEDTTRRHIWASDLAAMFIRRIQNTRNPHTLGELTLSIDACLSYDFVENVLREMKRQWHPTQACPYRFEDLELPNIMTTVQEDAEGDFRNTTVAALSNQILGLQRDGGLTGRRILDNVQPFSAPRQDMAIFASDRGRSIEFARRGSTIRTNSQVV